MPLAPESRRVAGSLFMTAGVLLIIAMLLRFFAAGYQWNAGRGVDLWQLTLSVAMLVVAVLVVRVGWRMRRDGRVTDEPGNGSIS